MEKINSLDEVVEWANKRLKENRAKRDILPQDGSAVYEYGVFTGANSHLIELMRAITGIESPSKKKNEPS